MQEVEKEDIKDYCKRITDKQSEQLVRHCNEKEILPIITAWYEDMEDFYDDWKIHVGYEKREAKKRFLKGLETGEFLKFTDGKIIRLSY